MKNSIKAENTKRLRNELTVSPKAISSILRGEEVWVTIPGASLYTISNYGRVMSSSRTIVVDRAESSYERHIPSKLIAQPLLGDYPRVNLVAKQEGDYLARTQYTHRLMVMAFFGKVSDHNTVVDHIDSNKLNNNITNLRVVSSRTNRLKDLDKSSTSSKFIGVHYHKGTSKWIAKISIKGVRHHIGSYNSEEEAAQAYLMKLSELQ